MPRIPINIVQRLSTHIKDSDVVVPYDGRREQHLIFLSKAKTLESINQYLKSDTKSVKGWLSQRLKRMVDCSDEREAFDNINTRSQLS